LSLSGDDSRTVTISEVPEEGEYTLKVTATDAAGHSVSATVTVTATSPPELEGPNNAPNITFPLSKVLLTLPAPASGVVLRARVTDPERQTTTLRWTQVEGSLVTLDGEETASLTITGVTVAGIYVFSLQATDRYGASTTGNVTLVANDVPVLVLEGEQTYTIPYDSVGQSKDANGNVRLTIPPSNFVINATVIDNHPVMYEWTQTKGRKLDIAGSDTSSPYLLDLKPPQPGEEDYEFTVTVTDIYDATATGKVEVHVNIAPGVLVGSDLAIQLPFDNNVTLVAQGVDLDGKTIQSYQWEKVRGAGATLSGLNTATLTVKNMEAGDYKFRVVVTDGSGASGENFVDVLVNADIKDFSGTKAMVLWPVNAVNITASTNGFDISKASFVWLRIGGPSVATLSEGNGKTIEVSNLQLGSYYFQFLAQDAQTAEDFSRQNFLVVVTSSPIITVEEDKAVQLPIDSVTLTAAGVADIRTGPLSYKWSQVDNLSPVLMSESDTPTVTITRLVVQGTYVFKVVVKNRDGLEASETIRVKAEGVLANKLAFLSSGVAAGSAGVYLLSTAMGAPIGYSLGIFNHLQLMAALPFIRTEMPFDLVAYARELRWSLLQQKLPFSTLENTEKTKQPSRRRLLQSMVPAGSTAFLAEIFEGNLVISVLAMTSLLALHALLKLISCCIFKNTRIGFPRLEFILMHFLFFGLALNAFFVVASLRSHDGSAIASVVIRFVLMGILFIYCIAIYSKLKRNIASKPSVEYKERLQTMREKALAAEKDTKELLDLEAGRSDLPEGVSPLVKHEWSSKSIAGESFLRNYGGLFIKFKYALNSYTYVAAENFEKFIMAAVLGCFIAADGRTGSIIQTVSLLGLIFFRFISLITSRPFRDGFETIILALVATIEFFILSLVLGIIGGLRPAALASLVVYLSVAAVLLFLIDALRVFVLSIKNYKKYQALAKGLIPKEEFDRSFQKPQRAETTTVDLKADPVFNIKRIRPEEMTDSVFRTSIYVPQLYRTFNVFIPEQNALAFSIRFAGSEKILKRGYILDVDPRTGNIFFWYDPSRWAAVIHSDWCKRKVGKLLAKRKQEILVIAAAQGKIGSDVPLWDDLDVSLAGAREEAFAIKPTVPTASGEATFPVYNMQDYARTICAPNGQYTEGIWRGYGFELVGFEFDLPVKASYFGSARIAACLDRACNVAKTASPNFLRVYDFFALNNTPQSRRIRVVAVVEPTNMDLETFLSSLDLTQYPNEYEDLMRGIIAQVVLAIHAAQTSTFDSKPINFRHNDLSPSNIAVSVSESLKKKLDFLRAPKTNERAPEVVESSGRRFVYYQVAERYLLGPNESRTYVPALNLVLDLSRIPLVKVVNFATSCSRVLDQTGRLSDDLVRGHQCPQRIPGESYDLKFFAIKLFLTLERLRKNLGPVPPAVKSMLTSMAGVDVGTVPAVGSVPDKFVAFPRTLLDSPFLAPLRDLPSRGPTPNLQNTYYYVEHPHDKVVPSSPLPQ